MGNAIVIVGPTAVGKTKVSIDLAREINGEIISADSMQVYKFMDIGTAKPDEEEMCGVNHYLISCIYPDQEFSVAKFKELALKYMDEITEKGKIPIIVGGTGLYINSLVYNINFSDTITDWELRESLRKEAEEKGNEYLHEMLKEIDPESAERIHKNDIKRIIRAIEVYKYTNKTISQHQRTSRTEPSKYKFLIYGLQMERAKLYDRINRRVDAMIRKGLVNEVRKLVEMGYDKNSIAMQGLGYKQILWYLKGLTTLEESIYLLKRDTRRYAKRQLTWFKRLEGVKWINVDRLGEEGGALREIQSNIALTGIIL
ncbi:MAG TPA: tRNA (adenosine(37)-N6)-dimethylallyltransferase MiaA [Clostridiaceae bacterium]|nr:tRNA (adenosine(37)-N6)-dimethylallyltransferase MiaA [Clostridiaceae bacterium]